LGATLLHTRGPLPEVKSAFAKALEIAEKDGDTDLHLACLRGLSEYSLWTGDARSVLVVSDKIRAIAISEGRVTAEVNADAQAGSALRFLGNLPAARIQLESVVERPLPYDVRSDTARFEFQQRLTARGSLAAVLWFQGFPDQAVEMARRQREEAESSNHAVSLCFAYLRTSCVISLYVGDLAAAGRFLELTRQHATAHGLTMYNAMTTCIRGRWLLDCGQPFELDAYRDALAELDELYKGGFRMGYPAYLANLSEGLSQHGDMEGARAYIDEAINLSTTSGQMWGVPEMLRMKGNLIRLAGRTGYRQAATDCYVQSITMSHQQGALSWELRSAVSLVELWRESGGNARAEAMLAAAHGHFREGFATRDLRRARSLLDSLLP
jgi:predicted ATPase